MHDKISEKISNLQNLSTKEPMPNTWSGFCFGCSSKNEHGLKLKFWPSKRGCFSYYTIPEYLCGYEKIAHGGIIATLLDEVAAWSIGRIILRFGITKESRIKYLKPVPIGMEVKLEGIVTEFDEFQAKTRAMIKSQNGEVLAECMSIWKIPTFKELAKMTNMDEITVRKMVENSIQPLISYLNDKRSIA